LSYLFKKVLFESFDTYILSDINSDVQFRVKQKNSAIFKLLQERVYNFVVNLDLPESITEDIKYIQENKSNPKYELEDKIYHFSKLWVAYYEAYFNGKIYNDIYGPILANISTRIKSKENAMFLKYINIDEEENDLTKYLLNVRRLQFNYRWNRMRRVYQISVMSHLYVSFFLAYVIGKIE
jgi:5'-deoxynucleotidase YfbR-like HD superfamily hydrolase